jgi:outer membrane lipoprotein-sorting protein
VVVVNKPDSVQTEVRVGHLGVPRSHPDYMALNLAIRILGGEGSNRLHQVLRTERGLTYGAQANMDALKVTGDFQAETNTRSEATGEVLRLIVDEFWRLQRERVGERELADAKAYMTGSFPLTIETPDSIAMQVVNVVFYGLPVEQLQTFRDRVNAVTVDDIQRVARDYLRPDRLSVVLVGNAAAFTSQLSAAGFSTFETIELTDLDLMAVSFKKPAGVGRAGPEGGHAAVFGRPDPVAYLATRAVQTPTPKPTGSQTPEEKARTTALLDRVIAAKGGLDRLRAIKTIVVTQTLNIQMADRETQYETKTYIEYPARFRTETKGPSGTNIQVFDGAHVWAKDSRGIAEIPETVARNTGATLRRDPVLMLIAAKDGSVSARLLPDVKDTSGRLYHALELASPDLNPIVLLIDPDSAQIAKQTFVADAPGTPLVEEEFSDYRPVDDVQISFHATRRTGTQTLERRITEIRINAPVDPALFKRPS